jgi:hypothetical protein
MLQISFDWCDQLSRFFNRLTESDCLESLENVYTVNDLFKLSYALISFRVTWDINNFSRTSNSFLSSQIFQNLTISRLNLPEFFIQIKNSNWKRTRNYHPLIVTNQIYFSNLTIWVHEGNRLNIDFRCDLWTWTWDNMISIHNYLRKIVYEKAKTIIRI